MGKLYVGRSWLARLMAVTCAVGLLLSFEHTAFSPQGLHRKHGAAPGGVKSRAVARAASSSSIEELFWLDRVPRYRRLREMDDGQFEDTMNRAVSGAGLPPKLKELIEALCRQRGWACRVEVTGSQSMNTAIAGSDVDIAVYTSNRHVTRSERQMFQEELRRECVREGLMEPDSHMGMYAIHMTLRTGLDVDVVFKNVAYDVRTEEADYTELRSFLRGTSMAQQAVRALKLLCKDGRSIPGFWMSRIVWKLCRRERFKTSKELFLYAVREIRLRGAALDLDVIKQRCYNQQKWEELQSSLEKTIALFNEAER